MFALAKIGNECVKYRAGVRFIGQNHLRRGIHPRLAVYPMVRIEREYRSANWKLSAGCHIRLIILWLNDLFIWASRYAAKTTVGFWIWDWGWQAVSYLDLYLTKKIGIVFCCIAY